LVVTESESGAVVQTVRSYLRANDREMSRAETVSAALYAVAVLEATVSTADEATPIGSGSILPTLTESASILGSLSPSRASDFKTCPLLYRFRTIDRLPEPPSRAATRGTVVHAVLERLFDLPPEQRTVPIARDLVEPVWQELREQAPELARLFPENPEPAMESALAADHDGGLTTKPTPSEADPTSEPGRRPSEADSTAGLDRVADRVADDPLDIGSFETWLESARELVEGYFSLEDPTRLQPAAREELIEVVVDRLRLRGYIDRLDVSADGQMRIVDYKTGSIPREAFEAKALFQMKFYALVLWRTRGVVPRQLKLIYLADRDTLTYAPDAEELARFERTLHAIWTAITRATERGEFRPSPSLLCGWCSHQALCPAFGGTPPPFPQTAAGRIDSEATEERPLVLTEP
jgi:putative RecB family exonuclease